MRNSVDCERPRGGVLGVGVPALAALLGLLALAGCGGAGTRTVGGGNAAVTARGGGSGAGGSGASAAGGSGAGGSGASAAGGSGPLAFSRCMRASGVPDFPDPKAGGGFQIGSGVDPSSPAFKAAQAKCAKLVSGAVGGPFSPGATTHPSPRTLARLRRIAVCMRAHGITQFPDPRTSVPSNPGPGAGVITDFDGVILLFPHTINLEAPAYRKALHACGAPPLGLPH